MAFAEAAGQEGDQKRIRFKSRIHALCTVIMSGAPKPETTTFTPADCHYGRGTSGGQVKKPKLTYVLEI